MTTAQLTHGRSVCQSVIVLGYGLDKHSLIATQTALASTSLFLLNLPDPLFHLLNRKSSTEATGL